MTDQTIDPDALSDDALHAALMRMQLVMTEAGVRNLGDALTLAQSLLIGVVEQSPTPCRTLAHVMEIAHNALHEDPELIGLEALITGCAEGVGHG